MSPVCEDRGTLFLTFFNEIYLVNSDTFANFVLVKFKQINDMTKQDFINAQRNFIFSKIDKSLENTFQLKLKEIENGQDTCQYGMRIFLSDIKPKVLTDEIKTYIYDRLIKEYKFTKEDIGTIELSSDNHPCILINLNALI